MQHRDSSANIPQSPSSRSTSHLRCGQQEVKEGGYCYCYSSSSRMRVTNHNWSATKQRIHPQSVAEISRHSVLSGDRIQQCGTSPGSRHKDTDTVCKSPFPSAGTAVSLFRAKTVQQRPLLPREIKTWLLLILTLLLMMMINDIQNL